MPVSQTNGRIGDNPREGFSQRGDLVDDAVDALD
jgi:hypothetical protein